MGLKREYQSMNLYQRGKHRKLLPLQLLPVSSSRTWYPEAAGHGHQSRPPREQSGNQLWPQELRC